MSKYSGGTSSDIPDILLGKNNSGGTILDILLGQNNSGGTSSDISSG